MNKYDVIDADYIVVDGSDTLSKSRNRVIAILALALLFIIVITLSACSNKQDNNLAKAPEYNGSQMEISTYTDKLAVYPSHILTTNGKDNFEFNIDLTDSEVTEYKSHAGYNKISYNSYNEDGSSTINTTILVFNSDNKEDVTNANVTNIINKNTTLAIYQTSEKDTDSFYDSLSSTITSSGYIEKGDKRDYMIGIDGIGYLSMLDILGNDSDIAISFKLGDEFSIQDTKNNNEIVIIEGETLKNIPEQIEIDDYDSQLNIRTPRGSYIIKSYNRDILINVLRLIVPDSQFDEVHT